MWWINATIGDIRAAQGDTAGALAAYQASLDAGGRMEAAHASVFKWSENADEIRKRISQQAGANPV